MAVFVARQPIFDRARDIYGYELLFRAGIEDSCDSRDGDSATLDVIGNSFLVIGFDELADGKRGFINFTRDLLVQGVPALLPSDMVVIEILEDVQPDEEVLAACAKLKQAGYTLAMDDFVIDHVDSPLIDLVDIIKVDLPGTTPQQQQMLCRRFEARGIRTLAEKVETVQQYEQARACGFSYFQGYFFSKPELRVGGNMSAGKLGHLRVLREASKAEMSYEQIGNLIKQAPAMTLSLLRMMNSSWFAFKAQIRSINHALVLLGPKEIRRWISLVALTSLTTDKPHELILRSLTRAKAAESVAPMAGMADSGCDLFLVGMFSMIDAMLDLPMAEAIEKVPLDPAIKTALLGGEGRFRLVHDMLLAYEQGRWDDFSRFSAELGMDEQAVPALFRDALTWANQCVKAA